MDMTTADLALQLSLALVAITVALSCKGPIRASLSLLLAVLVVGITIVMTMFYFNTGPIYERTQGRCTVPGQQKVSGDKLSLSGTPAVVTEEMKAPQRLRQEAAAIQEKEKIATAGRGDIALRAYRDQVKPPLSEARQLCGTIHSFPLNDLTSLDNTNFTARKTEAQQIHHDANKIADALLLIRPPAALSNTHQSLIGAAEHLRQAGVKLARFFSAENEEEEQTLKKGAISSANSALRSIDNFTKAAAL